MPQMQHYAEPTGRQRSSSHCSQDSATSSSMIEYGSGTFDQAANLLEVSCGSWPESNYQRSTELIEERLKQTIAEAMVEGTGIKDQQAGGARQKGGETEVFVDSQEQLSSSPGSVDSASHSFEARCSPPHTMDHILVFPPANSSPDSS
ncbi:BCAS3 microtubule associated cell migration factor-like [Amphiura filiformis]|uniref:BCAS3 microtubule associated cell migration factor-like n=1 Tax=Amphiura filiformis TaxID=82378 RepID=UPI003B21BE12